MRSIGEIAREIVLREGGYVNDPDDPGGATKYGVTIGTLKNLKKDLDGDGRVGTSDVKALTRAQAEQIFVEHYFNRPKISALPEILHASVFDMYVNAGGNAVKILQRLLTRMGFPAVDDGVIGPRTVRAAQDAAAAAPEHLADAYGIERRNYYYALAERRPSSRKYTRRRDGGKGGWITRAESFIAKKYHLTAAEHRERTAIWG